MIITEEYLREAGLGALTECQFSGQIVYGRVSIKYNGNADRSEFTVKEYGGLDDFALQGIINVVKVLRPKGWEDFVTAYTELKDAQKATFTARVNIDSSDTNADDGCGCAYFTVGETGEGA